MKKPVIILICGAILAIATIVAIAWTPYSRSVEWRHDYLEAEPLQELVWTMASEMEQFSAQHGRPPSTLDEIDSFSKGHNFSRLRAYRPNFTPQDERIFYLKINRRFAFEIDKNFAPKWAHFAGTFAEPPE